MFRNQRATYVDRRLRLGHAAHDLIYRVPVASRDARSRSSRRRCPNVGAAWQPTRRHDRTSGRDRGIRGRVADDSLGARILTELAAEGVRVDAARRIAGARSPVSSILVTPAGERLICSFSDPALDPDPTWLPLERLPGSTWCSPTSAGRRARPGCLTPRTPSGGLPSSMRTSPHQASFVI